LCTIASEFPSFSVVLAMAGEESRAFEGGN
jgi:hypothetical protein